MIKATGENPVWVHFGAGNIFRAFHAEIAQRMLDKKETGRGIIVAEGYDYEIVEKQYRPHDNLSILVTLCADGNIKKTVIGSIAESCILDSNDEEEYSRLKEVFTKESLQLCTFTITEKGYSLMDAKGELLPAVLSDFYAGPEKPQSYLGKVVSLLYVRFRAGEKPIAMVSTDNCSRNGEKLEKAVSTFADEWEKRGCVEAGFAAYVKDESKVSFPWSMIDKITPRPDASVEEMLEKDGLAECTPVFTAKKTCIAPFVNAEETEYLVIEDKFPNGRPKLEKGGVLFTDRATVQKIEQMKVQTCLNPLHTLLAVFGCLLGYTRISKEMQDEDLSKAVRILGYKEGLPVVVNPGILDPKKFIDTVVNVRIPNPFMPDTPQRIATDTSQKLSVRYGETIRSYMEAEKAACGGRTENAGDINASVPEDNKAKVTGAYMMEAETSGVKNTLRVSSLRMIPLVEAGWIRYLIGIDDNGETFELSPGPADGGTEALRARSEGRRGQ
jgi:fructuronate reductase